MQQLKKPRLPRSVAIVVWLAQLVLTYVGAPAGLADLTPRRGWRNGRPGPWNLLGLVPLVLGFLGLGWLAYIHLSRSPRRIEVPQPTPRYLLTEGPYRWSRNPMYVAGITTWVGWAIYYGSFTVIAGAAAFWSAIALLAVPFEERTLAARFGETYLRYKDSVPRWLGARR